MPPRSLPRPEVLWCGTRRSKKNRGQRVDGWSFPPRVRRTLEAFCQGKRVLHLFGGKSTFGTRLDLDTTTRPDVIGDAWLPPFKENSFDVVILDPPYFQLRQQEKAALMRAAGYIAREHVIWFHTIWIAMDRKLRLEKCWLVRVGDQCSIRCLQIFRVAGHITPVARFTRGPGIKYNRWLTDNQMLPFS